MGFWDNIVDALKIDSDDEDDDLLYENEMSELDRREKKAKKPKKEAFKRRPVKEAEYYDDYEDSVSRRDMDYEKRNSVPPRSPEGNFNPREYVIRRREIEVFKAYHFGDAQEVCDRLLQGQAIIVNVENASADDAQRIMDFVFGCVYAINGFFHPMTATSFLISETEIDVPTESSQSRDNYVPTFNKMI